MGASSIKWIALDSCLVFNEDYSKLYTNFELYEEKNLRHSKNIMVYKAKQIMMTWKNSKKKSIYLRRQCKWCTSRWYWTSDHLKFV